MSYITKQHDLSLSGSRQAPPSEASGSFPQDAATPTYAGDDQDMISDFGFGDIEENSSPLPSSRSTDPSSCSDDPGSVSNVPDKSKLSSTTGPRSTGIPDATFLDEYNNQRLTKSSLGEMESVLAAASASKSAGFHAVFSNGPSSQLGSIGLDTSNPNSLVVQNRIQISKYPILPTHIPPPPALSRFPSILHFFLIIKTCL